MSRKLTTYTNGSIAERIAKAPNIDVLAMVRVALAQGLKSGQLDPERKTLDKWTDAIWQAVLRFMFEAQRPGDLCYVYNVVLTWPKSPQVEQMLEAALKLRSAAMPSDAEWLLSQGIEIEGITKLQPCKS